MQSYIAKSFKITISALIVFHFKQFLIIIFVISEFSKFLIVSSANNETDD